MVQRVISDIIDIAIGERARLVAALARFIDTLPLPPPASLPVLFGFFFFFLFFSYQDGGGARDRD